MFSLHIVDTDAFLDMPSSAQLLYFHLCMRADDEGFVGNPKKIMRVTGASDDDYRILIAKRFVIVFESAVMVIKHWLIHNTIRMDRFGGTTYQDERARLDVKENKAYTLKDGVDDDLATNRQPRGNRLEPQVKLSKDKIRNTDDHFAQFWTVYPRKIGKGAALRAWAKIKPDEVLSPRIIQSVSEHLSDPQWKKDGGRFIPHPATYLNQARWEDEIQTRSTITSFA